MVPVRARGPWFPSPRGFGGPSSPQSPGSPHLFPKLMAVSGRRTAVSPDSPSHHSVLISRPSRVLDEKAHSVPSGSSPHRSVPPPSARFTRSVRLPRPGASCHPETARLFLRLSAVCADTQEWVQGQGQGWVQGWSRGWSRGGFRVGPGWVQGSRDRSRGRSRGESRVSPGAGQGADPGVGTWWVQGQVQGWVHGWVQGWVQSG